MKIHKLSVFHFKPILTLIDFFTKGHERSLKAKKNILGSLVLKGFSIIISLLTLPITLSYIDSTRYGIWLTLSSIVGWFVVFDIGLTQGLRNKFAEAKAKNDDFLARIYVSTTYAILSIIFFTLWIIFFITNNFLNWDKIIKVSEDMKLEVSNLAIIVFTYFCLSFVLKIITTILIADQKPAKSSLIDLLGQLLSLLFIVILVKTTEGSLVKLAVALCISPIVVLLCANLIFFSSTYKKYRPAFSHVKFSTAKELFNLGLVFFIIQIAAIVQYQTANIIIARNFSTADVTSYNVVYKYFSILTMTFNIFLAPFWSASTEAYQKNDIEWIRNGIRRYNQLNILFFLFSIIMLLLSHEVYRIWLGEGKVNIAFSLSFFGFLFFNVSLFGGKYVFLLNGISALRIQFISSAISPLLYVGFTLLMIKYFNLGVYAVFIASIISNFNAFLLAPLQYNKVFIRNKKGIWIK